MLYSRASFEAHRHSATLYVAGMLGEDAAERAEEIVASLMLGVTILRVDLRSVDLIDPESFVRIARALNQWRDVRRGRVAIEFPRRRRTERALSIA
jgi:hypothetical protein